MGGDVVMYLVECRDCDWIAAGDGSLGAAWDHRVEREHATSCVHVTVNTRR